MVFSEYEEAIRIVRVRLYEMRIPNFPYTFTGDWQKLTACFLMSNTL